MPRVEPVAGEPGRYLVESSRPGLELLVDMGEYDGNGWCGCEDFEFRCQPKLERGHNAPDQTRCRHIRAVIGWETERTTTTKNEIERTDRRQNIPRLGPLPGAAKNS